MRVAMVVFALLGAAGCSLFCGGPSHCLSNGAIVIRVVDADTKAPLADATVFASSGGSAASEIGDCPFDFENGATDAGRSNCRALPNPGSYHLTVQAPGYLESSLDVDAERDVCGHMASQVREVGLPKLGSVAQPLVNASEACGG